MNRFTGRGTSMTEAVPFYLKGDTQYYLFTLGMQRASGAMDLIPTITEKAVEKDKPLIVEGQFRSYNKLIDGKSKLYLDLFATSVELDLAGAEDDNHIELDAYIVKTPILRQTPAGKVIADIMLASQREEEFRSDYIPAIAWGRQAESISQLKVADKISLKGRLQSREYKKDGETRTAYELCIEDYYVL